MELARLVVSNYDDKFVSNFARASAPDKLPDFL